jgi:hypothetical protein
MATYRESRLGYLRSPATCDISWSEDSRTTGNECRRSSRWRRSFPVSRASSRRSLENHCRILLRARGVFTIDSQSRFGAASAAFDTRTSTESPVWRS